MKDGYMTSYRIDQSDCIYAVGNDWQRVAEYNNEGNNCGLNSLQGKSIFEQFGDAETRMIYAKIFTRVRERLQEVRFQIHCDELTVIRILEACIAPLESGHIEVSFRLVKEQRRDPTIILEACGVGQPIMTMCSYCGDLKDCDGIWQAMESEVNRLDLFSAAVLPKLSHGICPSCAKNFLANILNRSIAKK